MITGCTVHCSLFAAGLFGHIYVVSIKSGPCPQLDLKMHIRPNPAPAVLEKINFGAAVVMTDSERKTCHFSDILVLYVSSSHACLHRAFIVEIPRSTWLRLKAAFIVN